MADRVATWIPSFAHVLNIPKCSLIIPREGDNVGLVVVTSDNPMLRNLEIKLDGYPEIRRALETNQPVLVADVQTDPLYENVRSRWAKDGTHVATRSAIAIPFALQGAKSGVFFLRTTGEGPTLSQTDVANATR